MQIIRKFFIVVMALFLPYFILSQYTFKELDSIINRCSLDSTRFYLEKQKAKAKSTSEYFRFYVNNAQYYRDIRDYKESLLYLDSSLSYIETEENKGVYFQNKGLIRFFQLDYNKAIQDYQESLLYFKKGDKRASTFHSLSNVYKKISEYDSVYLYLKKAKTSFVEKENPIGYGVVLFDLAGYHFNKGQYDSSYFYYTEALEIYQRENDKIRQGKTYTLLANVYWAQKDYNEAIKAAHISDSLNCIMGYTEGHLISILTIAKIYQVTEDYDSSIYYLQSILNEQELNDKYVAIKQHTVSSLASVYTARKEFDLALKYQQEALSYAKLLGDLGSEVVSYYNIGEYYLAKEDSINAKKMFLKAYSYKDSVVKLELMKAVSEKLAKLYDTENKDSALMFYKAFNFYRDSIKNFNVQKELEINQLKTNALQLADQLSKEKKAIMSEKKQKNVIFFGVAMIIIVLVIVLLVLRRIRQAKVVLEESLSSVSNEKKENELELKKFKKYIQSPEASKALLENLSTDKDWGRFMIDFELLYPNFFTSLILKDGVSLTKNDCRVAALMHLKLSNKEMTEVLHITLSGVKNAKARFRAKLKTS